MKDSLNKLMINNKYPIKYNDKEDEFNKDLTLQMRLERYTENHFYPAKVISLFAPCYLLGGGIRDLMYAKVPKDLDFVVLGKENADFVDEVLRKYKIEIGYNRFGGYKFDYEGTSIDLWLTDDLLSAMQYNVDGLFYSVGQNELISLTFDDYIENGIKLVNPNNNVDNGREAKLEVFDKKFRCELKEKFDDELFEEIEELEDLEDIKSEVNIAGVLDDINENYIENDIDDLEL